MKHYVHFDTRPYRTKPKNAGAIQNYVLKRSPTEQLTIHEIIERATNGYTLIASKLDELREVEVTSLIFIDIDDDDNVTKLDDFKYLFDGRLTAYYYSFSYIEGTNNRLRLVFQLEEPVTAKIHSFIVGELIKEMQTYFKARNIDLTGTSIVDDRASKNAKRLFFGTSKGGAVLDESACISSLAIDHYENEQQKEQKKGSKDHESRAALKERIDNYVPKESEEIPFETLKAMAETIGGIPSKVPVESFDGNEKDAYFVWNPLLLAICHYRDEGFLSNEEAFELCETVSGDGLSVADYNGFDPDGRITIGTFIKYAIQRGYHFNNSFKEDMDAYSLPADKKHTVKAVQHDDGKEYVSKDFMKGLLQKPTRALVDSPTGSGKTYATVEAMKELSKGNRSHVYIIASPTRALAAQIAREREIRLVIGGTGNSEGSLKGSWQKGERVFSSTYDQVQKIIESVPANELILVVDEVHKLTTDREFRNDTIQKVIDAAEKARTFIGVTGTSADVYELMFDEKHTVKVKTSKTSKAAIPASDFFVLEYTTAVPDGKGGRKTDKRMELLAITQLIKSEYKNRGIRSLVFINNKKLIEAVAAELEKDGLNVFKVYRESSEDKNSRAYEKVVANDIDDDVDVILATKRIADGISLTLEPLKWNVVVLSDNRTRTFNPSEVRQMFHRIRSKYRFAVLLTRLPDQQSRVNEKAVRFHKNRFMNVLHRRAKRVKQYFDDLMMINMTNDDLDEIERNYGLYAKDGEVCIDLNVLNAETVRSKELYYSKVENRDLFIKEVAAGIGFQSEIKRNVFDYTLPDVDELLNGLEEEEEKPTAETLQKQFVKFYTPLVHESLHNGDIESVLGTNNRLLEEYRKQYGEARINAMLNVARIVESHEKARDILAGITRRNETNLFMDRLQVRNTQHEFFRRKRNKRPKSYTQTLYDQFAKDIANQTYSSAALRELKKELTKKHRIGTKDVNDILKLFTAIEEEGRSRQTFYTFLEFDSSIEASKFGLTLTEFYDAAISLLSIDELKKYAVEFEVKSS